MWGGAGAECVCVRPAPPRLPPLNDWALASLAAGSAAARAGAAAPLAAPPRRASPAHAAVRAPHACLLHALGWWGECWDPGGCTSSVNQLQQHLAAHEAGGRPPTWAGRRAQPHGHGARSARSARLLQRAALAAACRSACSTLRTSRLFPARGPASAPPRSAKPRRAMRCRQPPASNARAAPPIAQAQRPRLSPSAPQPLSPAVALGSRRRRSTATPWRRPRTSTPSRRRAEAAAVPTAARVAASSSRPAARRGCPPS